VLRRINKMSGAQAVDVTGGKDDRERFCYQIGTKEARQCAQDLVKLLDKDGAVENIPASLRSRCRIVKVPLSAKGAVIGKKRDNVNWVQDQHETIVMDSSADHLAADSGWAKDMCFFAVIGCTVDGCEAAQAKLNELAAKAGEKDAAKAKTSSWEADKWGKQDKWAAQNEKQNNWSASSHGEKNAQWSASDQQKQQKEWTASDWGAKDDKWKGEEKSDRNWWEGGAQGQNASASKPAPVGPTPAPVGPTPAPAPVSVPAGPVSDPLAVLAQMQWPADVAAWEACQGTVFRGHPQLPQGWIRCWSRSKTSAYFVRTADTFTTFDANEVFKNAGP